MASNPFLSPSPQTVLPVATRVDAEASGVAHKWPPTLSPLDSATAKPKEEKKLKRGRNEWGWGGREKLTGTWLLQDSALNLAATSGGDWAGYMKDPQPLSKGSFRNESTFCDPEKSDFFFFGQCRTKKTGLRKHSQTSQTTNNITSEAF